MKYSLFLLSAVLIFCGAGCFEKEVPVAADPCDRLLREEVARVSQKAVTLAEPTVLASGYSQCRYYTGEREILLQVQDDRLSVSEFVSQMRNSFPTNAQPSIEEQVGVGTASALVTLPSGGMMLYVSSGTGGYLLTNVANPDITREMLIQFGSGVVQ